MESELLPRSVGKKTKEECSVLLKRALAASKIETKAELSRLTGIPESTLGGYFNAVYLPPQNNWNIIREYLCDDATVKRLEETTANETTHSVKRLRALTDNLQNLIYLMRDELDVLKDSSVDAREILKESIDIKEAGYTLTLFKALFNEEELEIWKDWGSHGH